MTPGQTDVGRTPLPRTQCMPFSGASEKNHPSDQSPLCLPHDRAVGGRGRRSTRNYTAHFGWHYQYYSSPCMGSSRSRRDDQQSTDLLSLYTPCHTSTRHVIAVAQMLTSALLIHITGGRIRPISMSLARWPFSPFIGIGGYSSATIVVGLDHMVRGIFWPQSVYGILSTTPWRSGDAAWVFFRTSSDPVVSSNLQEMHDIANHRAQLEDTNQLIGKSHRTHMGVDCGL